MASKKPQNQILTAMFWMAGAIASFTAMAVAGREVSFDLDTFEIMFFRSLIGVAIVITVATATGHLKEIRTQRLPLHIIRNIGHFTGQNLWFFAIPIIPLAQLFALEFTVPIWVLLFSPLLLNERITKVGAMTAGIGFVGVLLVAQPGTGTFNIGIPAAAGAAICFALTAIFTRKLTTTDTITCILFYLTVLQAIFGGICILLFSDFNLPAPQSVPWVVLIGFAGLIAHFCMTKALSLAPASVVMPIDFVRLPIIAFIGMIFYSEPLNALVLVGAVLIFGANYLNILYSQRN